MTAFLVCMIFLASVVSFAFGYFANPERVRAFVKAHIVDDDPSSDESHSATRYAKARAKEIATARFMLENKGNCGGIDCGDCPVGAALDKLGTTDHSLLYGGSSREAEARWLRTWLRDHGIDPDEDTNLVPDTAPGEIERR